MLPSQLRPTSSAGFDLSLVPDNFQDGHYAESAGIWLGRSETQPDFFHHIGPLNSSYPPRSKWGGLCKLLVSLFRSSQLWLTWGASKDTCIYGDGNQNSGCLWEGSGGDRLGRDTKEPSRVKERSSLVLCQNSPN